MITPEYAQLMARYNQWQNQSLYTAVTTLDAEALVLDRGAFFGSILATLSHILWADQLWWSRFERQPRPDFTMQEALARFSSLPVLRSARDDMDQSIQSWADALTPECLADELIWFSGASQKEMNTPTWICVTHAFNHQTHHRGQAHAMLTAAGARPEDTDLPWMPGLAE